MSFYLVAGRGAPSASAPRRPHPPSGRVRRRLSDTSDIEWQLIAPLIPVGGGSDTAGGRPVAHPRRDIVDAIRYLIHNGCVWRAIPADFPPWPIVYHYFRAWTRNGTLARLYNHLLVPVEYAGQRR